MIDKNLNEIYSESFTLIDKISSYFKEENNKLNDILTNQNSMDFEELKTKL